MNRAVYLLGLPCTGKSTILKEWQIRGGSVLPEFLDPVPDFVHNSWLGEEKSRLQAEKWVIEQCVRKDDMLKNQDIKGTILIERSPLDIVVYGRVFGSRVSSWTETEVLKRQWTPGVLVFLTSSFDVLKERWMLGRGLSVQDWQRQWEPFSLRLQEQYEVFTGTYGIPTIRTDTSLEETMRNLDIFVENGLTYNFESLVQPFGHKERE